MVSAKARYASRGDDRVTLVIQAQNRADILLPVVALFHELNVQIEAIWMVRRKRADKVHITVTVKTHEEDSRKIEGYLAKVEGVLSVRTEGATEFVRNSPDNER